MRYYKKILKWENSKRIKMLQDFRSLLLQYFNNSHFDWMANGLIEDAPAQEARYKINKMIHEVHEIIVSSGINPSIIWTPPPVIGGHTRVIDIIKNMFILHSYKIPSQAIFDYIDQSAGIYESNQNAAFIRIFNPFFYLGFLIDQIAEFPFIALGKAGFDRDKAESSITGKVIKALFLFIGWLIPFLASLLAILQASGII